MFLLYESHIFGANKARLIVEVASEVVALMIGLFCQQCLLFDRTDQEALHELEKWILSLLGLLVTINIAYLVYIRVEASIEKKILQQLKEDSENWHLRVEEYKFN